MSVKDDLKKAESRPDDVLAHILRDHAEIKQLFDRVEQSSGDAKRDAFHELVRKLAVHETAEQEVVHPVARLGARGDQVVDARLSEEKEGDTLLAELERIGLDDDDFDAKLAKLRRDVEAHAEAEEDKEHPLVEEVADQAQLDRMKSMFELAEKAAPTHPHPHGPTSAVGNMAVGPVVAIVDRVRDALRSATQ